MAMAEPTTKINYRQPSFWKVVIRNDETTPVDFIVDLIKKVFRKTEDEATGLVRAIKVSGQASVYEGTLELCTTKCDEAKGLAYAANHAEFRILKEQL